MTSHTWPRFALVAALVTALLLPAPAHARAETPPSDDAQSVRLPAGWSLASGADGPVLRWRSPERLPWGGAALEVRNDGQPFAEAVLRRDLRTVTAQLTTEQTAALAQAAGAPALTVWSGGQPVLRQTPKSVDDGASTPQTMAPPGRVIRRPNDPGEPGPFDVEVTRYRLPSLAIEDLPEPVEVLGQVVAPLGAAGERPLVLLLHGRHETCYRPATGRVSVAWPCPDGTKTVPSYRGYTYLQRHLASRGFVTVSISANGINAQDTTDDGGTAARSALVRHHLGLWSEWAAPGGEWEGRVDSQKVLLLGHSRGGEGVQRAVIDSQASAPWQIAGSVLVAPTSVLRQTPAFAPTVTLLPTCDGDVGSLDGQVYVDRPRDVTEDPALRSAVAVVGGNHNFFNTEWTPGLATADAVDDAVERPECRTSAQTRISASQQRQVAKTYVAASALGLLRENGVALRLLDGSRVAAASTRDLDVRTAALGGRRNTVRPGLDGRVLGSDGAFLCEGRTGSGSPGLCGRGRDSIMTPHWPSVWRGRAVPSAPAMELQWTGGQGRAVVALDTPLDLSKSRAIEARVAVDPERGSPDLAFRLVDGAGRTLTLDAPRLDPLPGGVGGGQVWGQTLRGAIPQDVRFRLDDVRTLGVVARSERGRVWVLDMSGYRPGLSPLPSERLPRLDVRTVERPEGDSASEVIRLPLVLDTPFDEPAIASVEVLSPLGETTVERVRFAPGDTRHVLRFEYEGDIRDDIDRRAWSVTAYAERNLVVRSPLGRAVVVDDDPAPSVSVTPVARVVTEGDALQWQVQLSDPSDYGYVLVAAAVPDPEDRAELASDDVPRRWLRRQATIPDSPVPLHELGLQIVIFIPEGVTTATLRIPTSTDSTTEAPEWLALDIRDELGGSVAPAVDGKVLDNPT